MWCKGLFAIFAFILLGGMFEREESQDKFNCMIGFLIVVLLIFVIYICENF